MLVPQEYGCTSQQQGSRHFQFEFLCIFQLMTTNVCYAYLKYTLNRGISWLDGHLRTVRDRVASTFLYSSASIGRQPWIKKRSSQLVSMNMHPCFLGSSVFWRYICCFAQLTRRIGCAKHQNLLWLPLDIYLVTTGCVVVISNDVYSNSMHGLALTYQNKPKIKYMVAFSLQGRCIVTSAGWNKKDDAEGMSQRCGAPLRMVSRMLPLLWPEKCMI